MRIQQQHRQVSPSLVVIIDSLGFTVKWQSIFSKLHKDDSLMSTPKGTVARKKSRRVESMRASGQGESFSRRLITSKKRDGIDDTGRERGQGVKVRESVVRYGVTMRHPDDGVNHADDPDDRWIGEITPGQQNWPVGWNPENAGMGGARHHVDAAWVAESEISSDD